MPNIYTTTYLTVREMEMIFMKYKINIDTFKKNIKQPIHLLIKVNEIIEYTFFTLKKTCVIYDHVFIDI